MNATSTSLLTEAQKEQFHRDGYCFVERVIDEVNLEMLRRECDRFVEETNARMDGAGIEVEGISRRNSRYFIGQPSLQSDEVRAFVYGDLMADICRSLLGDTVLLGWEQFVVKAADSGARFGWHQDCAYASNMGATALPASLSCWCALDDMSEENGTVYVLPYSKFGGDDLLPHERDEELNDLVGYTGDDPGTPAIVPAGSIVLFSGFTFHRSGTNKTNRMRRVYLPQYTSGIAKNADGSDFGRAEPFLIDGRKVS